MAVVADRLDWQGFRCPLRCTSWLHFPRRGDEDVVPARTTLIAIQTNGRPARPNAQARHSSPGAGPDIAEAFR